ncbi:MAG: hypothetical protein GOVbin7581_44 [Prokaryotic dsDNA virus sp.]|nr:MAG: hypothetical protein GOVbin7581_44 [Prokaryotic dsDNA virus sp.]|tara:strand:+ start:21129 stop:22157 length:1029 start_codon:yes stop_codon:yes gene_type:complete
MKLVLLILLFPLLSFGQFYKYSTVYGGYSMNSTMQPVETYQYINNELIETTNEFGSNYRYQIGIKKIGRYKFEKKPKFYYDGKENNATIHRSPIGNFEYLLQYEKIKDRGIEYTNSDFWFRYTGKNYIAKIQSSNNGYVDLNYKLVDLRFKANFSDFQATLGVIGRNHRVYSINPFKRDFPNYNNFDSIQEQLGIQSESAFVDANMNGYMDRWEDAYTIWTNQDGDTIANSIQQAHNFYADYVEEYNKREMDLLGNQNTLSIVAGLSYYKYAENWFVLLYGNYLFKSFALTEYGHEGIDYDFGIIGNLKLTRILSLYTDINYLKYFDRKNYSINLGLNLLII